MAPKVWDVEIMDIKRKEGGKIYVEYDEDEPESGIPWSLILVLLILALLAVGNK